MVVGEGRDIAVLPAPDLSARTPAAERPSVTATLTSLGNLVVDEWCDPVVARIGAVSAGVTTAAARTAVAEQDLLDTYLWGAAELAARVRASTARERREWGAREMLTELALALRLPEGTLAHKLARLARLAELPRLREASLAGLVSSWHVDVVLDVFRSVTDPALLARADDFLAERAVRMTAPELRACARGWRSRHVPRTDEQRGLNLSARRVDVTPADDDLCFLTALIPAAQAVAIDHKLDQCAATAIEAGDERTHAQVRADALVDLLLSPGSFVMPPDGGGDWHEAEVPALSGVCDVGDRLPGGANGSTERAPGSTVPGWVFGVRPEVVLTVPVLSLLGRGDEPAQLEGFGPIDLDTARMLAATAPSFVRVLTHPETGAVLSLGRDRYRLPEDLRRVVRLRDRTCRFPGCRRRARGCDIDHSRAWVDGGSTETCNLACLCRKHHRLKHQMTWTVTHEPHDVLRWRSPLGLSYWTQPDGIWPRQPAPPSSIGPPPGVASAPSIGSLSGVGLQRGIPPSIGSPPAKPLPGTSSAAAEACDFSSGYPDEPPF